MFSEFEIHFWGKKIIILMHFSKMSNQHNRKKATSQRVTWERGTRTQCLGGRTHHSLLPAVVSLGKAAVSLAVAVRPVPVMGPDRCRRPAPGSGSHRPRAAPRWAVGRSGESQASAGPPSVASGGSWRTLPNRHHRNPANKTRRDWLGVSYRPGGHCPRNECQRLGMGST